MKPKKYICISCGELLGKKEAKLIELEMQNSHPRIICDECFLLEESADEEHFDEFSDADSGL